VGILDAEIDEGQIWRMIKRLDIVEGQSNLIRNLQ
jgi:hypothetical protein